MCHRLFIMCTIDGQLLPGSLQCLAQAGDIAVAENGEDSGEHGLIDTVDDRSLRQQITHQCLCHGESDFVGHMCPRFSLLLTAGSRRVMTRPHPAKS